jgi:hypothetical protein
VRFKEKGFVSILDAEISLVKSDVAVSTTLQQSLKNAVQPLEDIAEHLKDWHPGSGGKVLDLVHPSLFPAVYGLSRVLPVGSVPLNGCCEYIGKGETLPVGVGNGGGRHEKFAQWAEKQVILQAWGNYQWLPAAVKFDPNGKAKITSYINNLHPTKYQDLYQVLEQCVDASIPLWNEVLSFFHNRTRIHISATSDEDYALPAGVKYHEEEFDEWDDAYIEWKRAHHYLIWPEPEPFKSFEASAANKDGVWPVDLKNDFSETGLQIIFKLANIHLTPEMPTYDGGAWHIEGALNEHICATALYYYDEENITASHLAFRQAIDCEELVMKPAQVCAVFFSAKNMDKHLGPLKVTRALRVTRVMQIPIVAKVLFEQH